MQIDTERWQRLRAAAADAADDGPTFLQVQAANGRWARARDELARHKAAGPTGTISRPMGRARGGEEVRPSVGGFDQDGIAHAFNSSLRQLEADADEAGRQAKRIADRLRECGERSPGSCIRAWRCRFCNQAEACEDNDRPRDHGICALQVGCR